MKKLLAIVLSVILVSGAILVNVFAEASDYGVCGENLTWSFNEGSGELVISGTGEMWDFARDSDYMNKTTIMPNEVTTQQYGTEKPERPWSYLKREIITITVESGITSIGDYAFEDCDHLKTVVLSDSVNVIGDFAFRHTALENITIPDGVIQIGDEAFYGCDFKNITIPKSVENIGYSAFNYTFNLESITVDTDNTMYSNDEYGVLFNKDKTELIRYPMANERISYIVPDSVTDILDEAFYYANKLKAVTIGDNVKTIGSKAFGMCWDLESVILGNNVTEIGVGAFCRCSDLKDITIPKSVENIRYAAFHNSRVNDIFYDGTQEDWNTITIEENNDDLLSSTVHFISKDTPKGTCGENVKWTYIQETNELIIYGTGAMDNYSSTSPAPWDEFRADIKKLTVADGVTTIGNDTFIGCENLTEVSLPDTLTKIGDSAFRDCVGLAEIEIPDSVKSLGHYAFYGCTGFEEFWLGTGVKTIGNHAFRKCANLRIITIPKTLSTVNKNAFNGCDRLDFVIFEGTEEQWNAVTIGDGNEPLTSAMFRYGEIVYGDADGDGLVNSTDALWCLQHAVGNIEFVGDWADAIDINGDGIVNSYDAFKILQYSVGRI